MSTDDIEKVIRILKDHYSIGTYSRFLDEVSFDEASEHDMYQTVMNNLTED